MHGCIGASFEVYSVAQGHLQSLVNLRQLVDGAIGDNGHPHCIDGKRLGQTVSSSNAGSSAPDSGVNIVLLLQVPDPANISTSCLINITAYITCIHVKPCNSALVSVMLVSWDINNF